MLYSCMFSARPYLCVAAQQCAVKGPQMGMNRCHFNYVSSCWNLAESTSR